MADFSNTSEFAWQQFLQTKAANEAAGVVLSERDEAALFAQCVELQVLKAPATAQFPPLNQMIVNGSGGMYSVSGYVDSQNSYGAMIRTQYTYHVQRDMYGKWSCTDKFVSTQASATASVLGSTILYWIIGLLFIFITYMIISAQMDSIF